MREQQCPPDGLKFQANESPTMTYAYSPRLVFEEPLAEDDTGDIVSAVRKALAQAGELDSDHILVTAKGSDVKLQGWVSTQAEITRATGIAACVRGVHAVRNEVRFQLECSARTHIHITAAYDRRSFARLTGMAYQMGNC